jgi:hypothetical protein
MALTVLAFVEVDAVLAEQGLVADRRLVVDQPVVGHRFAVGVGVDRLAEDFGGVFGGRGGQADLDGVEVVQHAAVGGQVLRLVAHQPFRLRSSPDPACSPVGFVDDDAVELIDAQRVSTGKCA